MVDEPLSLFGIKRRFLRSTQLERDWQDPTALQDYVVTEHVHNSLEQLTAGLHPASGLRAWRITGDYGSGKSSFGLLIAHLFYAGLSELPDSFAPYITKYASLSEFKSPGLYPVLITGSREPLGLSIVRGLYQAFTHSTETIPTSLLEEWATALRANTLNDGQVLDWLRKVHKHLVKTGQAKGMLLLLDEAGKYLEFAALYPDQQDIFLLQSIAEFATRSGTTPFFIISLLHQGISAYAEALPAVQQKEWEKIAGRFEEILWHHPAEQVAQLIVSALNVQMELIEPERRQKATQAMQACVDLHWYGAAAADSLLVTLAPHLYPLHPTVIPPLIRFFASFGQNERSLFAFLVGNEPFGLQDFVERTGGTQFYCLHNLYDYIRNIFGPRMQTHTHRSIWKAIDAIVVNYKASRDQFSPLIKTVGLLNILDADDLLPSAELLQLALPDDIAVVDKLDELKKELQLYYRGRSGGYSVWPYTSINLPLAYESARKTIAPVRNVAVAIKGWLDQKPIIARRHYIKTGTLRYFDLIYCDITSILNYAKEDFEADGRIIIPLCETPSDRLQALSIARGLSPDSCTNVLVAVPTPLEGLSTYVTELQRWEWVERNTPGLEHDVFAKEEINRQVAYTHNALQQQIQQTIGIIASTEVGGAEWYWKGTVQKCPDVRSVLKLLSEVFDEVYQKAPLIFNELINRRLLSSAASAARLRLIDLLFRSPSLPYIGLDPEKTPPEMSMYLSVIQETNLHRFIDKKWTVALPEPEADPSRLLPTFEGIMHYLSEKADERVRIDAVNTALRTPPFGVRDGLFYLLLAVYAVVYETELAFYEDGTFIPRLTGNVFQRITKAPESFEIQYFPLTHIRSGLFRELAEKLDLGKTGVQRVDLLDVVRPLVSFAAALPAYTKQTRRLTPQALAVRDVLRIARDPANLLFNDLPKACGLRKIDKRESKREELTAPFVEALQICVDEIKGAYPGLLHHILTRLFSEFQLEGSFEANRAAIAQRADALVHLVTEMRLKSFCLRLADRTLAETKWAESLGSLVCSATPASWRDADVHRYEQEIHHLTSQFLRVEPILFQSNSEVVADKAFRVALTRASGEECDRVVHLTNAESEKANELKANIIRLVDGNSHLGLVAMAQALWDILQANQDNKSDIA